MRKYRLRKDLKAQYPDYPRVTFYQIEALRNFSDVKKGDLGGFIQNYHNLSQVGDCWLYSGYIHEDAKVSGKSRIYESDILNNSTVCGDSEILRCTIFDDSYLSNVKASDSSFYDHAFCEKSTIKYSTVNYNAIIRDATIIRCEINFGKVTKNLDKSNIVRYLYHLANILPVNNIYTFFLQIPIQIVPFEIELPIKTELLSYENLVAIEVDVENLEFFLPDSVWIHKIENIKPLTIEKKNLNMSKLDLILED
jgi:hypothetical protein